MWRAWDGMWTFFSFFFFNARVLMSHTYEAFPTVGLHIAEAGSFREISWPCAFSTWNLEIVQVSLMKEEKPKLDLQLQWIVFQMCWIWLSAMDREDDNYGAEWVFIHIVRAALLPSSKTIIGRSLLVISQFLPKVLPFRTINQSKRQSVTP